SYVACVPLIYWLTRSIFDARRAAAAAVMAALWPQGVQLGADVLSDMPHLAFYLAAVLAAGHALTRRRWWPAALVGVISAAAYLIRQEAFGLPLAAVVCIWWTWSCKPRGLLHCLLATVIVATCFLAPLLPYASVTGRLFHKKGLDELLFRTEPASNQSQSPPPAADVARPPSKGGMAAALGGHVLARGAGGANVRGSCSAVDPSARDDRSLTVAALIARRAATPHDALYTPAAMFVAWAKSGRFVFSSLVLAALLLPQAPPAARGWRRLIIVLIALQCIAVWLRAASFGAVSARYMLIPTALTIPWAASGWCTLLDRLARWRHDRSRMPEMIAALIFVPMLGYYALRPINAHQAYLREAGAWIRAHAAPADEILSDRRLCQVNLYAGLPWNQWPDVAWPLERILERDSRAAATWYVHLEGAYEDANTDQAVINAILSHPRWPRAEEVYSGGPAGHRVRVLRLRETKNELR
ncbi:MAG: glycosyltransferase family 39 protein, partial [Phycisphaerae bacterium]